MMRTKYVTVTASGPSATIPLDRFVKGYAVAVALSSAANLTYTVQHTFDNVFASGAATRWFPHDDTVLVAATSSKNSNFAFAPTACRLNVTSYTSGTAVLQIIPQEDNS